MKYLFSGFIWLASSLLTVSLFLIVLICEVLFGFFDPKRRIAHAQCFWWSSGIIALNPFWSVKASGLENIDHKKTYVVVANHQSLADIIVLYLTKMQFKWVAKASLFNIPFIGWCLSLTKHIRLTRGDFSSIKIVYREAATWLRKDVSVLFFPEGTRSNTDDMSSFQNGAFKLAIKEGRDILPIAIQGTREAIPKGGWIFKNKVKASLIVLPAIPVEDYAPADYAALRDRVFNDIRSAIQA